MAPRIFFLCPNEGEVIEGVPGDYRVPCSCGKQNPMSLVTEHSDCEGFIDHHARFLTVVPEKIGIEVMTKRWKLMIENHHPMPVAQA